MYVTRPLSMYKEFPSALELPPPEGPNSGILVILDEEAEPTCCFGLFKSHELIGLPFPQNKKIELHYSTGGSSEQRRVHRNPVAFIPVLDQPLSSNRYYAIQPRGSHKGEAFINAEEEDAVTCCFCKCFPDIEPQPADHYDIYQQFEICPRSWGGFVAKSAAPDGVPPEFLRRKGWRAFTSNPHNFTLGEAPGLDTALRARLPEFNFPLSHKSSEPVIVGKWYCPFIFIKDGRPKDQMTKSMFYEITLEQRWEQIFACDNGYNEDNVAVVDVTVETEVVRIDGMEVLQNEREMPDVVIWFRSSNKAGGEVAIGLSLAIFERMKWEEERFGWKSGNERKERIKRVEEFGKNDSWNNFGCYVLVERFVLRRMDGSLALTYDFKHTHHIRNKWE